MESQEGYEINPNDYYWVQWSNGVRYYVASTGKVIAKAKIPGHFLPLIKERNKVDQLKDLVEKIQETKARIAYLERFLVEQQEHPSIRKTREGLVATQKTYQKLLHDYETYPQDVKDKVPFDASKTYNFKPPRSTSSSKDPLRETFERYRQQANDFRQQNAFGNNYGTRDSSFFDDVFGHSSQPKASRPSRPQTQQTKDEAYLKQYGIQTKRQWKVWLVRNHPDKNPDIAPDLVTEIIAVGKRLYA